MLYRAGVTTPNQTFNLSESGDRLFSEKRLLTVAGRMPEHRSCKGGHSL